MYDSAAKQVIVRLRQTQEAEPFRLPLEFGLAGEGDANAAVHKVELAGREGEFKLPADTAPNAVTLDPNTWVLMAEPEFAKRAE
jgi:hypothetical protein